MERVMRSVGEGVKGREVDGNASRQRMGKRVARVESFVSEKEGRPESSQDLAARLREALASNTIGGRAGDEAKWRGMADEVRQAPSAFSRPVPVPGENRKELSARFHKACNRFFARYRRQGPPPSAPAPPGPPLATR